MKKQRKNRTARAEKKLKDEKVCRHYALCRLAKEGEDARELFKF